MTETQLITIDVVLQKNVCWSCGGVYALTQRYLEKRREDGENWVCPYCRKGTAYTRSEVEKLNEALRIERNACAAERARHDQTKMSLRSTKAAKTRLKKRIAKGVCPCCNRYFKNLHQHINTKHPQFEKGGQLVGKSLPSLYLGLTCMTQGDVDRMLPIHLQIPGKHWVSAEPLLGPLNFKLKNDGWIATRQGVSLSHWDTLRGLCGNLKMGKIDWVVVGCEKYKGKPGRFCDDEARWWQAARDIKNQCQAAGVNFWMKQGPVNGKVVTALEDMPEDMRVRQEIPR